MRHLLLAATLAAFPAYAAEDDHEHVAEEGDVRVLHAWTQAGDGTMRVFAEIENTGDDEIEVTGVEAEDGTIGALVGASTKADGAPEALGSVTLTPGAVLELQPDAVYFELDAGTERAEGDVLDMHILIEDGDGTEEIEIEVAVLGADADGHPHAGHAY